MEISDGFQAPSNLSLGKCIRYSLNRRLSEAQNRSGLFRQNNNLLTLPVLPSLWIGHCPISDYSEKHNILL